MPDGILQAAAEAARRAAAPNAEDGKPKLLLQPEDPDIGVAKLRDILSERGALFDRGVPVRLAYEQMHGGTVAQRMTPDLVMLETHRVCRPYRLKETKDGIVEVNAALPKQQASMYLDWRGEWRLRPLNGIASAPLLHDDGTIRYAEGYDEATGMWCENVPDMADLVPGLPTKADAAAALLYIRRTFSTFCFRDAEMVFDAVRGIDVVDVTKPPGKDESGFLNALLTGVCRPSLHLAPATLVCSASLSGSGTGKGLLVRCISIIAFGREPHAVTAGETREEAEKRIVSELIEGSPALFLDNLNSTCFKSDLLASAITERPARVRILGESRMVALCASSLIAVTGNALTVSEDLARRFITIDLDARTEDPEARAFPGDIQSEVLARRAELLGACLTIWRWGRQSSGIASGRPLGSFGQWCRWVRDPLLALGCKDPAERIAEVKAQDNRRQAVADIFNAWWEHHDALPMAAKDLQEAVRVLIDPQGRGRQFIAAELSKLTGTRMAGFVLTRQAPAGKWGTTTYALQKIPECAGTPESHRGHRGHRGDSEQNQSVTGRESDPMPPEHRGGIGVASGGHRGTQPDATPYARPMPLDHRGQKPPGKSLKTNGRDPMPPMPPMPNGGARDSTTSAPPAGFDAPI